MKKLLLLLFILFGTLIARAQFGYFNIKFYDSLGLNAPKVKMHNTAQGTVNDSILVKQASNDEIKRMHINEYYSGIKIYTDGFYASISSLNNGLSTKFNVPTGNTSQYIRGDGSIVNFPSFPVSSIFGRTGIITAQPGDYTTSLVTEGTNLYWTLGRFNTAFTAKSTTDLAEGTNLYFNTSRARQSISQGQGISYNNSTGIISTLKRQETYSGTTIAAGTYTITFSTPYSVAPNIQANIINGTDSQNIRTTAISTTGFTVLVRNRVDVIGLLPTWNNVSGSTVDVLITEK